MEFFEICETLGRCLETGFLTLEGFAKNLFRTIIGLAIGDNGITRGVSDKSLPDLLRGSRLVFDPGRAARGLHGGGEAVELDSGGR
jgi:hypothetical protein